MTHWQLHCPLCGGLFQVDSSLAGQQVGCPLCRATISIPAMSMPAAAPPLPPPPAAPDFGPPSSAPPPPPEMPAFAPPSPPEPRYETGSWPVETKAREPLRGYERPRTGGVDSLLPPGAGTPVAAEGSAEYREVPLPLATAAEFPIDPELAPMARLKEPEKKIVTASGEEIVLRRLTPAEKAARRRRKNVVMFVLCALVLAATIALLSR